MQVFDCSWDGWEKPSYINTRQVMVERKENTSEKLPRALDNVSCTIFTLMTSNGSKGLDRRHIENRECATYVISQDQRRIREVQKSTSTSFLRYLQMLMMTLFRILPSVTRCPCLNLICYLVLQSFLKKEREGTFSNELSPGRELNCLHYHLLAELRNSLFDTVEKTSRITDSHKALSAHKRSKLPHQRVTSER